MKGNYQEPTQEKTLFKTVYCLECKQVKICGQLNSEYCCPCSYQNQRENWTDYLTYTQALTYEKRQRKEHHQHLQQLVQGENWEDQANWADWKKFYRQKGWGLDLEEWLRTNRTLPVDIHCAKQWRENQEHLPEDCGCLERKAQGLHQYFTNCLQEDKAKLAQCQCAESEKVRVDYINSKGDGWTTCEKCEARIESAGHHGVIKNRNDPRFWGLNVREKVLCGNCLGKLVKAMPQRKKYLFWEYLKRGYE